MAKRRIYFSDGIFNELLGIPPYASVIEIAAVDGLVKIMVDVDGLPDVDGEPPMIAGVLETRPIVIKWDWK